MLAPEECLMPSLQCSSQGAFLYQSFQVGKCRLAGLRCAFASQMHDGCVIHGLHVTQTGGLEVVHEGLAQAAAWDTQTLQGQQQDQQQTKQD